MAEKRTPRVVRPDPAPVAQAAAGAKVPSTTAAPSSSAASPRIIIPASGIAAAIGQQPPKPDAPAASPKAEPPAAAAPAPKTASTHINACDRCLCSEFVSTNEIGLCRAKSPSTTKLAVPRAVQVANQQPYTWDGISYWPMVRRTDWCIQDFIPKDGSVQ